MPMNGFTLAAYSAFSPLCTMSGKSAERTRAPVDLSTGPIKTKVGGRKRFDQLDGCRAGLAVN
jgi:hypothetical protein